MPQPSHIGFALQRTRDCGEVIATFGVGMVCPFPFALSTSASPALVTARKVCRLEAPFSHSEEPL